jgi:CRP/FNR family transcriptional regulator, cyclic AMP receptor protein
MASDVLVRRMKDGAIVFGEGDTADGMYVILGGKVRIFRREHGHETTLTVLKQGDFFGEMSLFDKQPRSATAQVVGEAELRFISAPEFDGMIADPFVRNMLVRMSERLRHVDEELAKLDAQNDARYTHLANLGIRRDWAV